MKEETFVLEKLIKCGVCNKLKGYSDVNIEHFLCVDCGKKAKINIPEYVKR